MLEYEWINQSRSENDGGAATEPDQQPHRQIFNHLPSQLLQHVPPTITIAPTSTAADDFSTYHNHNNNNNDFFITSQPHHPFFDPRAFLNASSTNSFSPTLSHCGPGLGLLHMSKSEDLITPRPMEFGALGLNLGGRTYFASSNDDDDAVNYFYRHSAAVETCSKVSSSRCRAEGCNADLSNAKQYHRRHKVCEFHSKAATVVAAGLTQRFCQQCSRFHVLSEFDNGKRSCRKRLADHNRRRRKLQKQTQVIQKSQPTLVDNVATGSSPPDSGAQSSSSVMAAIPATIIPTKSENHCMSFSRG